MPKKEKAISTKNETSLKKLETAQYLIFKLNQESDSIYQIAIMEKNPALSKIIGEDFSEASKVLFKLRLIVNAEVPTIWNETLTQETKNILRNETPSEPIISDNVYSDPLDLIPSEAMPLTIFSKNIIQISKNLFDLLKETKMSKEAGFFFFNNIYSLGKNLLLFSQSLNNE